MTGFRVIDEGDGCEVSFDDGHVLTLRAQPGTIYAEDDAERIIAASEKYRQGSEHDTDVQIIVRRLLGREFLIRIDHSPPAWRWPKVMVSRKGRWIGAGWRMTLVQIYGPRRSS